MSQPFRHILVAIDFSPPSREALRVAADLAHRFEAPLTILHVYQAPVYPLPDGFITPSADEVATLMLRGREVLDVEADRARTSGAPEVTTELVQGVPYVAIVGYAKEHGIDLIVCGTHGWTGVRHALVGSTAERVVRKAGCAVLTVHAH